MTKVEFVFQKIKEIEKVTTNASEVIHMFNEVVVLEKKDLSRIIDNLGDSEDIETHLSWNVSTPLELQYIPTDEILEIFRSWYQFLKVQSYINIK